MEQTRITGTESRAAQPAAGREPAGRPASAQSTQVLIEDMLETLRRQGADVVFGQPRDIGGRTIIPVAKAQIAFGFGLGRGGARDQGEGEGGGGGGMVRTKPLGVVVVEDGQVRFRPTIDVLQIVTRVMLLVGIIALARTIFRR